MLSGGTGECVCVLNITPCDSPQAVKENMYFVSFFGNAFVLSLYHLCTLYCFLINRVLQIIPERESGNGQEVRYQIQGCKSQLITLLIILDHQYKMSEKRG